MNNPAWTTLRLGYVADTIVPQRDKPEDLSGPIPWLRIEDFNGKYLAASRSGQGVTQAQVDQMPLRVFPRRTVVTSCSCVMGATAIADQPIVTNQTFIGLLPDEDVVTADFLYYVMQAKRQELQAQATGAIQQYLSQEDFRSVRFDAPPTEEQRAITHFLDNETARIDTLIEEQQRLVATLRERRACVIDVAVWSGLDASAAMEATGIETVVAAPAHWMRIRNKNLFFESPAVSTNGSEELLTVSHLTGITPRSEKPNVNMIEAESLEGYRLVEPGDLVINTMWAWMGALGVSTIEGLVSPAYGVYRPLPGVQMSAKFFDYLYRSRPYVVEMTRHSRGIWESRLRLYPESFLRLSVVVPPLDEQRRIAAYLDDQTAKIDMLIAEGERLIELARERRSALITAAVTGQVDVREVA